MTAPLIFCHGILRKARARIAQPLMGEALCHDLVVNFKVSAYIDSFCKKDVGLHTYSIFSLYESFWFLVMGCGIPTGSAGVGFAVGFSLYGGSFENP
ncbi:MAG: hypothetical protein G01um101429_151 [Parcubacteria group bacterium Gr01-1014_29]|nr:MAG: hypothetical protein G01um101429_151 [Parcubacteria group bacterium Gr01-1014_29]